MAKDAKVGLLLSLVFIVAIAVVLRGVHKATHKAIDESLVISKDNNNGSEDIVEPMDLSSQAKNLSQGADASGSGDVQGEGQGDMLVANQGQRGSGSGGAVGAVGSSDGTSMVNGIDLVAHAGPNPNISQSGNGYNGNNRYNSNNGNVPGDTNNGRYAGGNDISQYNANGEIRYNQALPGQGNNTNQIQVTPPSGQLERAVNNVRVPVLNGGYGGGNSLGVGQLIATGSGARNGGVVGSMGRINSARNSYKIYIVKDGDNLSKIALKVYGAVAGKRWVNVKRIYKANGKALKSMDDIYVGQKLRIPALSNSVKRAVVSRRPGLSVGMKSRSIGGGGKAMVRAGGSARGRVSGGRHYRIYVVREGDTPWGIAQKQLGNGARFTDIGLPQGGHVTKQTTIFPGMRLRIPLR